MLGVLLVTVHDTDFHLGLLAQSACELKKSAHIFVIFDIAQG